MKWYPGRVYAPPLGELRSCCNSRKSPFLKVSPPSLPRSCLTEHHLDGEMLQHPWLHEPSYEEIQEGFFISSFHQRCWYLQLKVTSGIDNEESIFLFK